MFKVEKFWAVRKFLNQAVFAEREETLTAFTACLHGTKKVTLIFFLTSLRGFFDIAERFFSCISNIHNTRITDKHRFCLMNV